ncbi:hypothetical protein GT204_23350 [Streptomyces sp. SID4919]|nr:hypothetical protein [Streptomyces sp. SID4919]SCK11556.1 hypothetical protein YW7DRAFT_00637 [Streptomyces sp. AmelKG-E11A]
MIGKHPGPCPATLTDVNAQRQVRCVQCGNTGVIVAQATDPETRLPRWRYTCLDCRIAWWVDQHGGTAKDYERREPPF